MTEVPPRERQPHLAAWRVRNNWPTDRRAPDRKGRRAMARRGETWTH
jgi:hypothetical protein